MIKKDLKYKDYDGNEVEETAYFHLPEPSLVELQFSFTEGLEKGMADMMERDDKVEILRFFKKIVLMAYGIRKGEKNERFAQSEEIAEAWSETNAYNTLYMELFTNSNAAVEFLKGALPGDMASAISEQELKDKMVELSKAQNTEKTEDPTKLSTADLAEKLRLEDEAAAEDEVAADEAASE